MDYKYSCVVDAESFYKDIVLQWYRSIYRQPPSGEDGTPNLLHAEPQMEWVIDTHALAEGERTIDAPQPYRRPHTGADGFVRPRWDDDVVAWIEGATAEVLAVWEADHPAPEPPGPSPDEQLRADIDYLAALGGVAL